MGRKPVADRGPNEVGTVGIEAFLHQEIDVAEVDVTKVDRDLFRLARSVAEPMNLCRHCVLYHLSGWYMDGPSDISRPAVGARNQLYLHLDHAIPWAGIRRPLAPATALICSFA